jgi:hypothetical protein
MPIVVGRDEEKAEELRTLGYGEESVKDIREMC